MKARIEITGRIVELGSVDGLPGEAEVVVEQLTTGKLLVFRVSEEQVVELARAGGYLATVTVAIEVRP